jgi:drug/metabolite transporter (DMT)-like permease
VLSTGQLIAASGILLLATPFGGFTAPTWRADAIAALLALGVIGTGVAYVINYRIIGDDGPCSPPPSLTCSRSSPSSSAP